MWFIGLIVAAVAIALGYHSQQAFHEEKHRQLEADKARGEDNAEEAGRRDAQAKCRGDAGERYRRFAKLCWLLSLVTFVLGALAASYAMQLF